MVQQILFTEQSIIPDSWWLTNPQLRRVFSGMDLATSISMGWLVAAVELEFAGGVIQRYHAETRKSSDARLAHLVEGDEQRSFLEELSRHNQHSVVYDRTVLGSFFSNWCRLALPRTELLDAAGLSQHTLRIREFIASVPATEQIGKNQLFRLLGSDNPAQAALMRMVSPVYAVNAPVNYGFNAAFLSSREDDVLTAAVSVVRSLAGIGDALNSEGELVTPLAIGDPAFLNPGFLRFEEVESARLAHFERYAAGFRAYARGRISKSELEDVIIAYQSNLKDHLCKRNRQFDLKLSRGARYVAVAADYGKGIVSEVASAIPEPFTRSCVKVGIHVLGTAAKRALESASDGLGQRATRLGTTAYFARLESWTERMKSLKELSRRS